MAAITAVVNSASHGEPPEHLFLSPGSNDAGSRLSVASRRASAISTRSVAGVNSLQSPGQQPTSPCDTAGGAQRNRRSSLRNSLLVGKDLPDLPSARPVTPTRARAAPPSSYAPPESIAQRLVAVGAAPGQASPARNPASSSISTAVTAPVPPPVPVTTAVPTACDVGQSSIASQSAPERPSAVHAHVPAIGGAEHDVRVSEGFKQSTTSEENVPKQSVRTEDPAPIGPASKHLQIEALQASSALPDEVPTVTPFGSDVKRDTATPSLETIGSQLSPSGTVSESAPDVDITHLSDADENVKKSKDDEAGSQQMFEDVTSVSVESSDCAVTEESTEQPSLSLEPSESSAAPHSPVSNERAVNIIGETAASTVKTPDDEVPDQTWSSSSHPSTPRMLPHTPVGEDFKAAIASSSPPLTPLRTGSPVALMKQRNVSAPVAPLIKEPEHGLGTDNPTDIGPTNESTRDISDTHVSGGKAYATPSASPIGMGHPPVSQKNTQLRSASLPLQRRLSSPPKTPSKDEPSLDEFVGLMKQVISREKGMSIRQAARVAEQRKPSVPA